jgi:hypothetical protein
MRNPRTKPSGAAINRGAARGLSGGDRNDRYLR